MQVRLRPCKVGDVVTVKNCDPELPDRTEAVVVGHDSGRVIVEAFGKQWNVAMQCVDNGQELWVNGVWLDQHDRRAQKALAMERRAQMLQELRRSVRQRLDSVCG